MIQTNETGGLEAETVGHSIGQVIHDVVALAELQYQLFKSDCGETVTRLARPTLILTAGLALLLTTTPLFLVTIALALIAVGLLPAAAFALVTVLGLAVAVALVLLARQRLRGNSAAFARSKDELARNIAWIKSTLQDLAANSRHSAPDSRRDRGF